MKIRFRSDTHLGKWSVGLILLFFLLMVAGTIVSLFQSSAADDTFFGNPVKNTIIVIGLVAGICASLVGVTSIIKSHERSILVILVTCLGLLLLIFLILEFAFPH